MIEVNEEYWRMHEAFTVLRGGSCTFGVVRERTLIKYEEAWVNFGTMLWMRPSPSSTFA